MTFVLHLQETTVPTREWYWELGRVYDDGHREKFVNNGYKPLRTEAVDAAAQAIKEALAGVKAA